MTTEATFQASDSDRVLIVHILEIYVENKGTDIF